MRYEKENMRKGVKNIRVINEIYHILLYFGRIYALRI